MSIVRRTEVIFQVEEDELYAEIVQTILEGIGEWQSDALVADSLEIKSKASDGFIFKNML